MLKNIALTLFTVVALVGCSSNRISRPCSSVVSPADFATYIGDRIHFGFDTDALSESAKEVLDRQVNWLNHNANEDINIIIEGHCDERGTREYNLALGERRANSAKDYLVNKGVDASRIEIISYGKERPAAIGNSEDIHKLNRRTVTVLRN